MKQKLKKVNWWSAAHSLEKEKRSRAAQRTADPEEEFRIETERFWQIVAETSLIRRFADLRNLRILYLDKQLIFSHGKKTAPRKSRENI